MTRFATTAVICLWQALVATTASVGILYVLFTADIGRLTTWSLFVLFAVCLSTQMVWLSRLHNAWRTER